MPGQPGERDGQRKWIARTAVEGVHNHSFCDPTVDRSSQEERQESGNPIPSHEDQKDPSEETVGEPSQQ